MSRRFRIVFGRLFPWFSTGGRILRDTTYLSFQHLKFKPTKITTDGDMFQLFWPCLHFKINSAWMLMNTKIWLNLFWEYSRILVEMYLIYLEIIFRKTRLSKRIWKSHLWAVRVTGSTFPCIILCNNIYFLLNQFTSKWLRVVTTFI